MIIDSSPILPVADTRFVSQYADTVVLSVFRDLSEVPKIQATCEFSMPLASATWKRWSPAAAGFPTAGGGSMPPAGP